MGMRGGNGITYVKGVKDPILILQTSSGDKTIKRIFSH